MRTVIELPWPPSVNRYWRSVGGRVLISADGRKYRGRVEAVASADRFGGSPVLVSIYAHFPDQRRRDLDNLLKAPLDALTAAGMWDDDSQIQALTIRKVGIDSAHPRLVVTVESQP